MRKKFRAGQVFFRIGARQGMNGGQASPSGPATAHLEPRIRCPADCPGFGRKVADLVTLFLKLRLGVVFPLLPPTHFFLAVRSELGLKEVASQTFSPISFRLFRSEPASRLISAPVRSGGSEPSHFFISPSVVALVLEKSNGDHKICD